MTSLGHLWFYFIGRDVLELSMCMEEHPEQWSGDEFYLKHEDGLVMWVANGRSFLAVTLPGGTTRKLNIIEKSHLWKQVNKLKAMMTLNYIRKHEVTTS